MAKANIKSLKVSNIIINHVTSNLREYIIVSLMFIVGIFLGVMFVNNSKDTQKDEFSSYINNYISQAKEEGNSISTAETLTNSIKNNVLLALGLWFAGTTLIGIPIVFGIILFRGFCLGYTISASTYTLGFTKGLLFMLMSTLLQNILFIPALLALGVSGIKLYKSIMKDKRKENIKLEILRHTIFSLLMLAVMVVAAIVKVNVSGGMFEGLSKYF